MPEHAHHRILDDTDGIDPGVCPAHSGICVASRTNTKSIENIWLAHDKLQETVNKIMSKISYIVGGVAALQTVAIFVIEYLNK
jgi:hypothetical protein